MTQAINRNRDDLEDEIDNTRRELGNTVQTLVTRLDLKGLARKALVIAIVAAAAGLVSYLARRARW